MFNPKLFETEHKKSYVKKSGYIGANNILSKINDLNGSKKHIIEKLNTLQCFQKLELDLK